MKKRLILSFVIILLLAISANAKYVQTCNIKYKTESGWSKYYTVEVTFMTGSELNKATTTWNYDTWTVYSIIWWANSQCTVISLSSYLLCGTEVTQTCIANNIYNLEGKDRDGTSWEICTKGTCW